MRIAADGTTALTSRNDLDLTAEFAELAGVLTAAL
jgi:bifunctional non-homologous end joining protein LigD